MRMLSMLWPMLWLGAAMAISVPVYAADYSENWSNFRDDMEDSLGEAADYKLLTHNYQMDVGMVEDAYWALAWRDGGEVGVMLKYIYASPVSPAELPAAGPMKFEEVEITLNCAARTVRMHKMYLYRPDGSDIGRWFDPAIDANPESFGSDSIIGLAWSKVC